MKPQAKNIKNILVLGATGLVGRNATRQLVRNQMNVRILTRDAAAASTRVPKEVEVMEGDLTSDELALQQAMHHVDGLFIALPESIVESAISGIMAAALLNQVKQVVYISGNTVCAQNAWHPMIKGHFAAECCIENSGIPFTILKPTMIMDTIPAYANRGKSFLIGNQPHKWSWIHTEDIARYVGAAFQTPNALNQKLAVLGPEKSTIKEAVEMFNRIHFPTAKPVRAINLTLAKILSLFIGKKFRYIISIFEYFQTHCENSDAGLTVRYLGHPTVHLNDFIQNHTA